mgnify:FL=1
MKDKLVGLLKDKKQRGFWVWLVVLCILAGATAALFYLYFLNGGKVGTVFSLAVKGKRTALLVAAAVAVVGVALGGGIRLLRGGKSLRSSTTRARWVVFGICAVVQPFVLLLAGELPQQGVQKTLQWVQEYFGYVVWGWLLLVVLWLLVASLANGWVAALVTGAVSVVPGIISAFKLAYRGNPVFPWDIYALGTLADIADELVLELTCSIVLAVALWALMVAAAVPVRFVWPWRERLAAKRKDKGEQQEAAAMRPEAAAATDVEADNETPAGTPEQEPPLAVGSTMLKASAGGRQVEAPAPETAAENQLKAGANPARKRRPPRRLWAVLGALALVAGYTWAVFFSGVVALPTSGWGAKMHYKKMGQMTAFVNDIKMLTVDPPAGYSRAAIQQITETIPAAGAEGSTSALGTQKPHIIMIMGESFYDMETVLTGVQFEEELLPNFHAMQRDGVSGQLLVSSLSGGTSLTEFQALTGFSAQFFPSEYTPYMQAVRQPFFSYAQYLKAAGYTTLAMHPHRAGNWNRSTAYPFLGFDAFYARKDDSGVFDEVERERTLVSDKSLMEKITQQYEKHLAQSDDPLFLFAVTMQNHAAYKAIKYSEEAWVSFEAPEASAPVVDQLLDYATGLHSADAALGNLLAYFEARQEPVLVIYFGDHMSFNSDLADRTMLEVGPLTAETSGLEHAYLQHLTPFAAWSNQGGITADQGAIGAYNLLPVVLGSYGLPMPRYFEYLLEMRAESPGFEYGIALNPDGSYNEVGQMNPVQQRAYRQFELLQYDYIFGRQYAEDLFPLA